MVRLRGTAAAGRVRGHGCAVSAEAAMTLYLILAACFLAAAVVWACLCVARTQTGGLLHQSIAQKGCMKMFRFGKKKKEYGVIERGKNFIKVKAPSGADALRLAGMDGKTAEGANFIVANHQGNGVYYVEIEPWPSEKP